MTRQRPIRNFFKVAANFFLRPCDTLWFLGSYWRWQKISPDGWKASFGDIRTFLKDRHDSAGSAKGHYFLQDIWAARKVREYSPENHVDVGSRVDGFVSHVVCFCPVTYVDIRKLETGVPGLTGITGSVCELPFPSKSVSSLSCLHVIEHIGLGRYGDPLDPDGWKKGLAELQRVLKPGGRLLVGTPCGRSRVVFHAHRVFSPRMIVEEMPELKLVEFAVIMDGAATSWIDSAELGAHENLDYGCGLFVFQRDE